MPEQSELQIFVSYAVTDQDRVSPVYDFLIRSGYPNTWMDCKKLLPGQPWDFEIRRNLRKSEVVVIFFSRNSVSKRGYVQREIKLVTSFLEEKLQDDIYVIPVKLDEDAEIPESLSGLQYLSIDKRDSLQKLKMAIDAQRDKLGFSSGEVVQGNEEIHSIRKVTKESWEGLPGYEVEYSWPSLYSSKFPNISEVSKIIEAEFISTLQHYRKYKLDQHIGSFSWSQDSFLRTSTYEAHYRSVFNSGNFIGVTYSVSWYGAGAAHPNYHAKTFNFLLNPLVRISDLKECFEFPDRVFNKLVDFVRGELLKKTYHDVGDVVDDGVDPEPLLEEEWVKTGAADWDCLNIFSFDSDGLVIEFAPYQVGPFAAGSFSIAVPYSLISEDLQQELKYALSIPW